MSRGLVVGTRGSRLALAQAGRVVDLLGGESAGVRVEVVRTEGDRRLDVDLAATLDRGLFTKELEDALLDDRIDVAVHSLKDLPTSLAPGLSIAAVLPRDSPGDVLLVRPDAVATGGLLPLRAGAVVGTGAPRRAALLAHAGAGLARPPVFRGNVPTRVDKCRRGEVDAVVLARAGLERLELDPAPLVAHDLSPDLWLPAPGQAAIAVQARTGDAGTRERLAALSCPDTAREVAAERGLLELLEAGCHAALGALARVEAGRIRLRAGMLRDGAGWVAAEALAPDADVVARMAEALERAAPQPATGAWATPAARWW